MDTSRVKLLCLECFVVGALGMLVLASFPDVPGASYLTPQEFAAGHSREIPHPEKVPPCGKIKASAIPFADPNGAFTDRDERLQTPRWFFAGFTKTSLSAFLDSCQIDPKIKESLLDQRSLTTATNGCFIKPSPEVILSLPPHCRQKIYSVLARSTENYPQYFAFTFPLEGFDAKFRESGLSASQLAQIRSLTYTNGNELCFADLQAAQSLLKPHEFNQLIQTFCAVPAYLLKVRISPDSDVDALVKYWGKGGREKVIAPLISSLAKVPGGVSLNVSYLLPPFARLRLYTYPDAWNDPAIGAEDCIFTSLNFFKTTPDTNYLDQACRERVLNTEYVQIEGEPTLGDLVTLVGADGHIVHVCVYIAEGFVFTKNGSSRASPWILMKMPDMLSVYNALETSRHVVFLREKAEKDQQPTLASQAGAKEIPSTKENIPAHLSENSVRESRGQAGF